MNPNTTYLTDYVDGLVPLEFMPGELAFLRGICPGFEYFALFCGGRRYAFFAVRFMAGSTAEVHLVVKEFGPQKLKKLRDQFSQFQRWCRDQGIEEVCTFGLPGAEKAETWIDFASLLGFGPVQTMYVTQKPVEV